MFKNLFGDNPQTKILDFLADHPNYDYNISDLSKKAEVSRPTVYKFLQVLLKKNLIIKTRDVGTSSMYKLNLENNLVKLMLKFDFELAKEQADLESEKTVDIYEPILSSQRKGSKVMLT
jgi:Fe2+ or Zn2+ uptake regulation protein